MTIADPKKGLLEDAASSERAAIAFLLAAAVGIAGMVVGKSIGLHQYLVTAIPVITMSLYAVLLLMPRFRLRNDSSGDNLYYLGFLYTLTSIALALYQFSSSDPNPQIVSNFGIAIATTVCGLILRIVFNQMRVDPAEVERSSRLELADAARRMRREIDEATLELNVFRRTTVQQTADFVSEIEQIAKGKFSAVLEESAQESQDFSNVVRAQHSSVLESLREMTDDSKQMSKQIREVLKQLQKMQAPDAMIQLSLEPAVNALQETLRDFRLSQQSHATSINSVLRSIHDNASQSTASMQTSTKVIESLLIQLQKISSQWESAPLAPASSPPYAQSATPFSTDGQQPLSSNADSGGRQGYAPAPYAPIPPSHRPGEFQSNPATQTQTPTPQLPISHDPTRPWWPFKL